MCTAATYQTKDFYFGRTLDYEFSYGDEVTIMPRNYEIAFRHMDVVKSHYAMIGMAYVTDDYPLYYDAVNEKGVGMAGLNFVGNAVYANPVDDKENVAQFEFIPWILSQCASVQEARALLAKMNLVGTPYNEELPAAQLHWMIADAKECIVVESMADGMHIHDNPTGVMTNNPPFEIQMFLLNQYMGLSEKQPQNHFSKKLPLQTYSRGMGAIGLPGDLSSTSEEASVSQFFHILGSVDQQRGCCEVSEGKYEITIYTSCCNATKGIYYYTAYDNHQITGVDMHRENLDGTKVIRYPLRKTEQIAWAN